MNRKEGTKHRKRKSNKLKILFWAILFAFVSVLILYLFSLGGENGIAEILNMRDYWLSVGVANGLILIGYLMMYRVDAQNIALNENDLEDTEWLSVKRLKKLKEFQVYDYKAADSKQDGIVIGAEKKGGNVEVITTSQLHALIVGTTGSGKTTGFVDQNIAVLGKSQSKPSIVISDPKKELYEKHAKNLEKQGYKISVLDLREPYSSERWNPMNVLLRRIRLVKDLENNLEQKDGKYYGAGEVFLSYRDARTRMQELTKSTKMRRTLCTRYVPFRIKTNRLGSREQGILFSASCLRCARTVSKESSTKNNSCFSTSITISASIVRKIRRCSKNP
mgnify:CR=1 FL=1